MLQNNFTMILISGRTLLLSPCIALVNRSSTNFEYCDAINNTTNLIINGSKVRQYYFTIGLQYSGDTKIQ